jgi:hypothetical protein
MNDETVEQADEEDLLATKSPMRHWRLRRGTRRCPQQRGSARASAARVEQPTDWLSPSGFTSNFLEDEPGRSQRARGPASWFGQRV